MQWMHRLKMQRYKIEIKCFNTDLIILLSDNNDIEYIANVLTQTARTLHNSFNKYDCKSEISKLNREKRIIPSKHLYDILKIAQKYEQVTDYHFNTNQSFKEENNIIFVNNQIRIENPIDLGAIAKGYFMMLIKNFFEEKNIKYEMDFGGALLFSDSKEVKVRDPNNHLENIIQFKLIANECIHTSSYYWQVKGENSHIHQKKKGYKIVNKSISVIDENPILADVFSTAMYSMELKEVVKYANKLNLKIIYIVDNTIYISKTIENYTILNDKVKVKKI